MSTRWTNNSMVLLGLGMLIFFILFSWLDPREEWRTAGKAKFEHSIYEQLIAYEPRTNQKALLAFENGECGKENLGTLKNKLWERREWFFGIPYGRGVYTEYIHLVYVHHFEKVICNDKEYYRARLAIRGGYNDCDYLLKLKECGTDLMERRIYRKMVNQLERLGIGDARDYKPRKTVRLKNCNCSF